MRRTLAALAIGAAAACPGFGEGDVAGCEALCATAAGCGFLPSALGWSEDGDPAAAEQSCVQRCDRARSDDATAAAIVGCLTGAEPGAGAAWCGDAASESYAAWSVCGVIQACFDRAFPDGHELGGEAALTVRLLTFSDYLRHYAQVEDETDVAEVAALYRERSEEAPPASCTAALCSEERCPRCFDDECSAAETVACDPRMCRVGALSIAQTCKSLGTRQISLVVRERGRTPAVQSVQDEEAGINQGCGTSIFALDRETFQLRPGPIEVVARVRSEATVATLKQLGAPAPAGASDTDVASFCFEFVGPPVIARAGGNEALVPIGALDELLALKAELAAAGASLSFCP